MLFFIIYAILHAETFLSLFQKILLGILHALEVELREGLLHQRLNLVVAEIADAAFVSMMNILVWLEFASLDFQSYLLVSIAEWHAVGCKLVHFFY